MNGPDAVREIAKQVGGEIKEMGRLPDGSGFAVMSMPLPKDHWIGVEGYNIPPMPFRRGSSDPERQLWADKIRMAGKYAIRASTMNGKDMDFDPDAMLQNLIVGMLGYWTADGLSGESFDNPPERTQWCCDGDGKGGHHAKCRYSRDDSTTASPPRQS